MTSRLSIDYNRCQGHMLCAITAPALFTGREDDGRAELLMEEIPDDQRAAARRAVAGCPEQALRLTESDDGAETTH